MQQEKPTFKKRIILMARSEIRGGMAVAELGTFPTIKDAEIFGQGHFKALNWQVAEEIHKIKNGKIEDTEYKPVSPVFNPRRGYED